MRISSTQNFIDPSVLKITNWEFNNFYYDLNAIINPNQFATQISITGTTFSRISNCGSIIKNYNNYPTNVGTVVPNILTQKQEYFNYMSIKIVNTMADIYHSVGLLQTPFTISCPLSNWSSLIIEGSTFQYLGDKKELLKGTHIVPPSFQRYQGMALNLVNFPGEVILKGNTFKNNYVMIDGCSYVSSLISPPTPNVDIVYINATATLYQLKTVVSIMNHPQLLVIGENIFTENVGMKGIMTIEIQKQKEFPLLIIGNTFTSNSGFLFSDALYIKKITENIYDPNIVQSSHFCNGIYMVSNTFTNNIGCKETSRGSVIAYCQSTVAPGSAGFYEKDDYLDHQKLTGKDSDLADKVKFLSIVNFEGYSTNNYVYTYGGAYGTITYNMEQVLISTNSFTSNYGGKGGAILTMEAFPYMKIENCNFENNGNNIPDLTLLYSSISKYVESSPSTTGLFRLNIVSDSFLTSYGNKMISILSIDMVNSLSLSNLNFINNWVIDHGTAEVVAHSLKLRSIYKKFNCLNCQFIDNKGISNDPVLTTSPNTVDFSSLRLGIQRPVLNFENFFFR